MTTTEKKEFILCPRCGGPDIHQTDYEDENGEEDVGGCRCDKCSWEGDRSELVCGPVT